MENAKQNLVFHFGGGRHAAFPKKSVVKETCLMNMCNHNQNLSIPSSIYWGRLYSFGFHVSGISNQLLSGASGTSDKISMVLGFDCALFLATSYLKARYL